MATIMLNPESLQILFAQQHDNLAAIQNTISNRVLGDVLQATNVSASSVVNDTAFQAGKVINAFGQSLTDSANKFFNDLAELAKSVQGVHFKSGRVPTYAPSLYTLVDVPNKQAELLDADPQVIFTLAGDLDSLSTSLDGSFNSFTDVVAKSNTFYTGPGSDEARTAFKNGINTSWSLAKAQIASVVRELFFDGFLVNQAGNQTVGYGGSHYF